MAKIHGGFRIKRRRRRRRRRLTSVFRPRSGYNRYIRPTNRARSISRIFHSLKKKAMSFCSSCKPSNSRRWGYVPLNGDADNYSTVVVPKGYTAVYVGQTDGGDGFHQFTIPVIYFNHPLFGDLLREAQDEFGFNHPGKITIPCRVSDFENVQTRIAASAAGGGGGRRKLTKW